MELSSVHPQFRGRAAGRSGEEAFMLLSQFSGRRIKRPEQGLLSMHPFVDVLEGRNLFTATLHDGALHVTAVIDAPANEDGPSPWSDEPITSQELSADDAAGSLGELLATT